MEKPNRFASRLTCPPAACRPDPVIVSKILSTVRTGNNWFAQIARKYGFGTTVYVNIYNLVANAVNARAPPQSTTHPKTAKVAILGYELLLQTVRLTHEHPLETVEAAAEIISRRSKNLSP
jgi:hypothetical protein